MKAYEAYVETWHAVHVEVTMSEDGEDNENNQEHDDGYRNNETIIGENGIQRTTMRTSTVIMKLTKTQGMPMKTRTKTMFCCHWMHVIV